MKNRFSWAAALICAGSLSTSAISEEHSHSKSSSYGTAEDLGGPISVGGEIHTDYNTDGSLSTDGYIKISAKLSKRLKAVVKLELDHIFYKNGVYEDPNFDIEKFIEEAYIEFKNHKGKLHAIVIGKQPVAFGNHVSRMPNHHNSPTHDVNQIKKVFAFTIKFKDVGFFDLIEASVFESETDDLSIGDINGLSVRLTKNITEKLKVSLSAAKVKREHEEKIVSIGFVNKRGKWTAYGEFTYRDGHIVEEKIYDDMVGHIGHENQEHGHEEESHEEDHHDEIDDDSMNGHIGHENQEHGHEEESHEEDHHDEMDDDSMNGHNHMAMFMDHDSAELFSDENHTHYMMGSDSHSDMNHGKKESHSDHDHHHSNPWEGNFSAMLGLARQMGPGTVAIEVTYIDQTLIQYGLGYVVKANSHLTIGPEIRHTRYDYGRNSDTSVAVRLTLKFGKKSGGHNHDHDHGEHGDHEDEESSLETVSDTGVRFIVQPIKNGKEVEFFTKDVTKAVICSENQTDFEEISLWMTEHGHGSSDVEISKLDSQCVQVSGINFLMAGLWEIRMATTSGKATFKVNVTP